MRGAPCLEIALDAFSSWPPQGQPFGVSSSRPHRRSSRPHISSRPNISIRSQSSSRNRQHRGKTVGWTGGCMSGYPGGRVGEWVNITAMSSTTPEDSFQQHNSIRAVSNLTLCCCFRRCVFLDFWRPRSDALIFVPRGCDVRWPVLLWSR